MRMESQLREKYENIDVYDLVSNKQADLMSLMLMQRSFNV